MSLLTLHDEWVNKHFVPSRHVHFLLSCVSFLGLTDFFLLLTDIWTFLELFFLIRLGFVIAAVLLLLLLPFLLFDLGRLGGLSLGWGKEWRSHWTLWSQCQGFFSAFLGLLLFPQGFPELRFETRLMQVMKVIVAMIASFSSPKYLSYKTQNCPKITVLEISFSLVWRKTLCLHLFLFGHFPSIRRRSHQRVFFHDLDVGWPSALRAPKGGPDPAALRGLRASFLRHHSVIQNSRVLLRFVLVEVALD